jgi:hypothetical protein
MGKLDREESPGSGLGLFGTVRLVGWLVGRLLACDVTRPGGV